MPSLRAFRIVLTPGEGIGHEVMAAAMAVLAAVEARDGLGVRSEPIPGGAHHKVDAMALDLVRRPWEFDVLPTEKLFGYNLMDLGAGLIGGMGFAPSVDIGDEHALFQPRHGTAPDIAGRGVANPGAMILSAGMMLDWLGERQGSEDARLAARAVERAVDLTFGSGQVRSHDIGGSDGTEGIARAVADTIRSGAADPA